MNNKGVDKSKRQFLTTALTVVGAVGTGYLAVPFLAQMQPSVKAMAATHNQVASNCAGLDNTAGQKFRLWWITGDCNMGPLQVIGSADDPVILVDDHELNMSGGGAIIHGLAYLFDNPDSVNTPSAQFVGTPSIMGAFVSDIGGNALQGSYSIVYQPGILDNLSTENDSANYSIAFIPGSWRDF